MSKHLLTSCPSISDLSISNEGETESLDPKGLAVEVRPQLRLQLLLPVSSPPATGSYTSATELFEQLAAAPNAYTGGLGQACCCGGPVCIAFCLVLLGLPFTVATLASLTLEVSVAWQDHSCESHGLQDL